MEGGRRRSVMLYGKNARRALRYLVIIMLFVAVCFEGYYIFVLRATVKRQTEDLRNISIQLQMMKSERERLSEEIFSAKEKSGEGNYGDTIQR